MGKKADYNHSAESEILSQLKLSIPLANRVMAGALYAANASRMNALLTNCQTCLMRIYNRVAIIFKETP